jgi:hypothetical protein
MTVVLPANLRLCFERGTWREQRNVHFDEDITESGKPIRSKKPSTPLTPVSGSLVITHDEKVCWDAFFKTGCAEGSVPFQAPDRTGNLATFWWLTPPGFSDAGTSLRAELSLARE